VSQEGREDGEGVGGARQQRACLSIYSVTENIDY
jgi:hypothetical protein